MDFYCEVTFANSEVPHGFFEASEPFSAPVSQTWPCPTCGADARKVILRAPTIGKIAKGTFVVDFPGGHTLTRDDVEERIQRKPGVPFEDDPGYAERIVDRALIRAHQYEQGEIAPRPEPTAAEMKTLETALAKQGIQ